MFSDAEKEIGGLKPTLPNLFRGNDMLVIPEQISHSCKTHLILMTRISQPARASF